MITKKRKGFKFIKEFPRAEPIVAMIEHQGRVMVATTRRVLELKNGVLVPIMIANTKEGMMFGV